MKQIASTILLLVLTVTLITVGLTGWQVIQENDRLNADLTRRSNLLAESLNQSIEPNFTDTANIQLLVEKFSNRERFAGMAVYNHREQVIAMSSNLQGMKIPNVAASAMDEDQPHDMFSSLSGKKMYFLAIPIHERDKVIGSLMIVQNANYINERLTEIWTNSAIRWSIQVMLVGVTVYIVLTLFVYKPINDLVVSVKRSSIVPSDEFGSPFFKPLTNEIAKLKKNLIEAKVAASEEARLRLERIDSPWTSERLTEFIKGTLRDRNVFVVSNREPYVHSKDGNRVEVIRPASGMVTAIEPLMEACGGTWIAQATGNADKTVVNTRDELAVPPDDPRFTLHRIWLTEQQNKGFYDGFSNEAMWPLFHMSHTRPIFRSTDWKMYVEVNRLFADSLLKQIKNHKNPLILVQDFHFALLPRMIKEKRPDAMIGLFWHIPWISAEHFSICPNKKEIIYGMLGADLIGFHTQLHCNNFIETVSRELESLVDYEHFTIVKEGHRSWIKPFPISIPFSNGYEIRELDSEELQWQVQIRKQWGITAEYIALGVDRLDYTKGILERLKAIEIFLQKNPAYQGNFTFIQIAAPTRESVSRYQQFAGEVRSEVLRINKLFKSNHWKPIVLIEKHHNHHDLNRYYRFANVCLVTSLHDGMNLVAKEFIAARYDGKGTLILSNYTGASRELHEALIINPYDGDETAAAVLKAIEMPAKEQMKRMKHLRQHVRDHNVYRWSASFLKTLVSIE